MVPLNTIDFANVWGKFDPANAAVYGTLIAFLVVYVIAALYLRRQDKKDEEKVKKKTQKNTIIWTVIYMRFLKLITSITMFYFVFIVGDTFS